MLQRWFPQLIVLLAVVACVPLYWPGLYGSFIFDDLPNLGMLQQWLAGNVGWTTVVFENLAGPLGRPLSMATFLADAAIWGMNPFGFKLVNVVLHAAIGVVIFILLGKITRRDRHLRDHAMLISAVITAIWLLHPLQVGTVLYIVQRMAMLSTLFMLLALLAYMTGREQIECGRHRRGALWLFVGVPLLTVLAALAKENGLLALALCGVLEWVYFRPAEGQRRAASVRHFVIWLVLAPVVAGLLLLLLRPELLLADYGNRPFTLLERLLTQTRVLFDYSGKLLLPIGNQFSFMRDDYTISTGLFSPWTTAVSVAGWLLIVGLALRLRTVLPAFTAGIGLFLVGHAMESSVFPLMMYFEHRNYLPAVGLFLAVAGLLVTGWRALAGRMDHPQTLVKAGLVLLLATLMFATYGRALIWQTKELLVLQSLQNYPESSFVRAEMASLEMNRPIPDVAAAREHFAYLTNSERMDVRMKGELGLIQIDCFVEGEVAPESLANVFSIEPETMEADLVMSIRGLVDLSFRSRCQGLEAGMLAIIFLPGWIGGHSRTRYSLKAVCALKQHSCMILLSVTRTPWSRLNWRESPACQKRICHCCWHLCIYVKAIMRRQKRCWSRLMPPWIGVMPRMSGTTISIVKLCRMPVNPQNESQQSSQAGCTCKPVAGWRWHE